MEKKLLEGALKTHSIHYLITFIDFFLIIIIILQAARLLGLGTDKIVLLDNKTKILAKSQNTSELLQVILQFILLLFIYY